MPYAFNQESYRQFQEDILAAGGDQATLTSVLADMQNTMVESMALVETTRAENETILNENTRLKDANMKLFLQVGETAKSLTSKASQPIEDEDNPKYSSIDDYMTAYFNNFK